MNDLWGTMRGSRTVGCITTIITYIKDYVYTYTHFRPLNRCDPFYRMNETPKVSETGKKWHLKFAKTRFTHFKRLTEVEAQRGELWLRRPTFMTPLPPPTNNKCSGPPAYCFDKISIKRHNKTLRQVNILVLWPLTLVISSCQKETANLHSMHRQTISTLYTSQ